jgi:hypothetical protein
MNLTRLNASESDVTAIGPLRSLSGCIPCHRLCGDRASAARRSAHVPRLRPAAEASSFTSLRSMPHRLDPANGGVCFLRQSNPGSKPRKLGGQRSEVKGERRAQPVSEDMSGVARPASSARASRRSARIEPTQSAQRSGPSRMSAKGRNPPCVNRRFLRRGLCNARWSH